MEKKPINTVSVDYRKELSKHEKELRLQRRTLLHTIFPVQLNLILGMPFIYLMIIPAIFLHICLEIYHQVCFRLYGIPLVPSKRYFVFDRGLLPYLNWFEKINCFYCEYFNCLLQYAVEIAGRTERFWCPIKHARKMQATHSQYKHFVEYLDGEHYQAKAKALCDFSDISEKESKKCDFMK